MFPKDTRFLIVDDFPTMRKIMKKVLSELGYKNFEEADDGGMAVPMLEMAVDENKPFGFIICDSNMPQMQGLELLHFCRNDLRFKTVPFLLVAAELEPSQLKEATQGGASEYILKPFNAATLKLKLEKCWIKHTSPTSLAKAG